MQFLSPEEKKIAKARVSLLLDSPFFGYIVTSLELEKVDNLQPPTMGTNGKKLFYHPQFVKDIGLEELKGVLAHEVMHVILYHITRRDYREPLKWNIATDLAVNGILMTSGTAGPGEAFELPAGVLHNPAFDGKAAEWIYDQLPDIPMVTITLDSHEGWPNEEGNGHGENGDGDGPDDKGSGAGEETKGGLEQHIRETVAQASTNARMQGKLPGNIQELVDGILQPVLNWKAILRDMIVSCAKSDYCITPPNMKHLYRGFYLPGMTGTEIRIAAVIDTSGSISNDEMKEFLSEVKGICDSYDDYTIHLMTCDTRIHQRWELHPFDTLPKVLQGRGGTDFREPLKEAASLPITALVYLTDGYGTFPDKQPKYPVIWISTTDCAYPWGRVIRLKRRNR